jgi:DNA-directed RNA polymerase omega subunit
MTNLSKDSLNKLPANRFAVVIIAAKQARKINQLFLSEREKEEKEGKKLIPAVEALKSLSKGEIEFQYPEFKIRKPR